MNQRKTEVFLKLIAVLKTWNNKIEMHEWVSISSETKQYHRHINDCGTSACIGGLIPLADKEFANAYIDEEGKYKFLKMTRALVENEGRSWEYIFDERWGNNPQRAVRRIRKYIRNGEPPKHYKAIDCFN